MKTCLDCGDPAARNGRCTSCARLADQSRWRRVDQTRGTSTQRGYGSVYQRRRLAVIGKPCELQLSGCTGIAERGNVQVCSLRVQLAEERRTDRG